MRLLTHNSLRCNRKDATTGFPLKIHAERVEVRHTPCNRDFIIDLVPTLNWEALRKAALEIGVDSLPDQCSAELLQDSQFMLALHHVLMDVHVIEGALECEETGQRFPVHNGITNML